MSVAEAAHRPAHRGRAVKLWLGFLVLIAFGVGLAWIGAGIALAWVGAGSMRSDESDSGLRFRTVTEGTGEPISTADAALLDYVGTLDDGTVFDSSESHGGPQPFTAGAVFPGFAEAIGRMREGGEYRFTMPPNLAWGAGPPPPGFPADSNLTFDVRVRKIIRGGAALMQQQMQEQQAPAQAR